MDVRVLRTRDSAFRSDFAALLDRSQAVDPQIERRVHEIIADVRDRGDAALLEYTARFDRLSASSVGALEVPRARLEEALKRIGPREREALEAAAGRVRAYHERQRMESWSYQDADGTQLGQQITPLDRVGLYVPGGKAAYPSSVLMNAVPAKIAGVPELIMVVPAPGGELNDMVLAAAAITGIDRVFTIGGAQAVAALAYGTDTIPRVDKIVGPGNIYVATAKRQVFGQVAIDMIAGPSEIVVVSDGRSDPEWIAMDLFSQAEHDEEAQAILLTPDEAFARTVQTQMTRLVADLPRAGIVRAAIENRGALIVTRDLDEAIDLVNAIAPEHLELALDDAAALLPRIRHAGAIFVGRYTPEALGDYCAGPNHVLPTSGTARFSSPLGVYDFQKRTSIIACSPAGASRLAATASVLAHAEGLTAHARSAEFRIKK